jgi:hypothetical protein
VKIVGQAAWINAVETLHPTPAEVKVRLDTRAALAFTSEAVYTGIGESLRDPTTGLALLPWTLTPPAFTWT